MATRKKPQNDTKFIWGTALGILAYYSLGSTNVKGEYHFTSIGSTNAKYINHQIVDTVVKGVNLVKIYKVQKEGTSRYFYIAVTEENKRIGSTLWARKYDTVAVAQKYLKALT